MNEESSTAVSTESDLIFGSLHINDNTTCKEIREAIEVFYSNCTNTKMKLNYPCGSVYLYSNPFYLCDDVLYGDICKSVNEICIKKLSYGEYWMICVYMEDTLLYPIPLDMYFCEEDVYSILNVFPFLLVDR